MLLNVAVASRKVQTMHSDAYIVVNVVAVGAAVAIVAATIIIIIIIRIRLCMHRIRRKNAHKRIH